MNLSFTFIDFLVVTVIVVSAAYAAYRGLMSETLTIFAWAASAFATAFAGLGPPVSLILNNDPQFMRGARSARQRGRMLQRLALVMPSSEWLRHRLLDRVADPARDPVVLNNCIDVPPVELSALLELEAHLEPDLHVRDLALLDVPADLGHLEPVQVTQRL